MTTMPRMCVSMVVLNFKVTPKRLETRCLSQESVDQEVKFRLGFSRVLCSHPESNFKGAQGIPYIEVENVVSYSSNYDDLKSKTH